MGTSYQVVAQQFLDGYGKGVKMVKIAVVADIHGNLPALAAVWADIKWQGVDEILCLGDVVGYYPWPNEVIEFIRERAITLVQGNYDESVGEELPACGCDFPTAAAMLIGETSLQWTINTVTCENKRWLQDLPKNLRLQRATYDLLLVHGSPDRNNEYLTMDIPATKLVNILAQEKVDILLCGHTHVPYHRQVRTGHVINAGSVGKPKHGNPNATYVIVRLGKQVAISIKEVPYDYEQTAQRTIAAGLPEQLAAAVRTGLG